MRVIQNDSMQLKMKAGLSTVGAALVLVGVIAYQANDKQDNCVVASSGERSLAISGGELRLVDRGGRAEVVPADQALIDTESGLVAVIGDQAVPVKGTHEQAEARRMMATR